jgi:hypothetical protein
MSGNLTALYLIYMAYIFSFLALLGTPLLTFAQSPGLQDYVPAIIAFFNQVLIPFLFGIAFLIFIVNVVRFFIVGAANEQDRGNAKMLALYSILSFVILIVFWGLVNLIAGSTGLGGCSAVNSDYIGGDPGGSDCFKAPVIGVPNHTDVGNNPGSGGNNAPGTGTNVAPGTHFGPANVPPPSSTGGNRPPTGGAGNNDNPSNPTTPTPATNPFPVPTQVGPSAGTPEEPISISCLLPNGSVIETTEAQCRLLGGTYSE